LEGFLRSYLEALGVEGGRGDEPIFRTAYLKTKTLTTNAMTGEDICRMLKRRLKAVGSSEC
jgi:integrase/recombinase XerD